MHRLQIAGLGLLALAALALAGVVIIPAASPASGAEFADALRSVVGVQPVAELESLSNRLRDDINRTRFAGVHAAPQISWSGANRPAPTASASVPPAGSVNTATNGPLTPATDVVTADPQLAWQPYGSTQSGVPLMARAMVFVDQQRSYAGVALVRIDLSRLRLNMMPGFIEPAHPSGISKAIADLGTVPTADRANLVAAFNGGFKAIHGHYGMMVDGITLLPPLDGMGTVAVYKDGSVKMGTWNKDLLPSQDMVALRQNCPPLIDAGLINPALDTDASRAWGFTHNTDITWRTGLGLSEDGRYLLYAVGNGTDAKFLAQALQKGGAYWAMQLDINQYYAQFDTYSPVDGTLTAQRLLDQMTANPKMFVTPDIRDFFYLTLR